MLWTRTTADSKPGTKAKLESAYRSNNSNLFVVVKLAASKGRGSVTLNTRPRADTGKAVLNQNASDLSKGVKTLAYLTFKNAKFGGTLHIPFYDDSGSSYGNWDLGAEDQVVHQTLRPPWPEGRVARRAQVAAAEGSDPQQARAALFALEFRPPSAGTLQP